MRCLTLLQRNRLNMQKDILEQQKSYIRIKILNVLVILYQHNHICDEIMDFFTRKWHKDVDICESIFSGDSISVNMHMSASQWFLRSYIEHMISSFKRELRNELHRKTQYDKELQFSLDELEMFVNRKMKNIFVNLNKLRHKNNYYGEI